MLLAPRLWQSRARRVPPNPRKVTGLLDFPSDATICDISGLFWSWPCFLANRETQLELELCRKWVSLLNSSCPGYHPIAAVMKAGASATLFGVRLPWELAQEVSRAPGSCT